MTITNEDIIAIIGEEKIKAGMENRCEELKTVAANQYAIMQTAPQGHRSDVPEGAACGCQTCWGERLDETLTAVTGLQERLSASTAALVKTNGRK
jgi:hypothetical protein